MQTDDGGTTDVVLLPLRWAAAAPACASRCAKVGEHTDEMLGRARADVADPLHPATNYHGDKT